MKYEKIKFGNKELFFTGLISSFGQKIYQGSILKVSYIESYSNIFEKMKKRGDTEIYFYIPEEFEYFGFNLVSADNKNYWIPSNKEADITFLRYLINKGVLEVVGNSANKKDQDLFFKVMHYQKKEYMQREKEKVFAHVISLLQENINKNIGIVKKTEIKNENFIEITYTSFFEDDSLERKTFQETVEAFDYDNSNENPRFKVDIPFRSSSCGEKTILCKIITHENMFI